MCKSKLGFIISILIFGFYACRNKPTETITATVQHDTLSTALLDSLGELVYEHYAAFEKQPDLFLEPIENKQLNKEQKETYTWILINMAYGFQEHSRYLASTKYYEKALLYDKHHQVLSNDERFSYIYKPLANNYTILADYQQAERLQLQAIQETSNPSSKASFYNNLALLYVFKGEEQQAKNAALSGLHYKQSEDYLNVLLHNTLSAAYVSLGQMDSARIHNHFAIQEAEKLPLDASLAAAKSAALERLSQFQRIDQQTESAQKSLTQALALAEHFFPNSHYREKANLLNLLGEHHLLQDKLAQAKIYFQHAKAHLEQDNSLSRSSNYTLINILENLGIAYAAHHTDSALWYFEQAIETDFAFQQSIRSRASHLKSNMQNRRLLENVFRLIQPERGADQAQLKKLLWLTELTKGRLLWNEINRSAHWEADSTLLHTESVELQQLYALRDQLSDSSEIAEINQRINKLQTDFDLEEQYFSKKIHLPDFNTFQQLLAQNKDVTYAYFIHADSSLSIFRTAEGRLAYYKHQEAGLIDSIAQFKAQYFADSPAYFNENPERYFRQAENLYQLLLPNLSQGASSRIQLSLDNELHILPFDALYNQGHFVVQDYEVQYVHTLLMRLFYHNHPQKRQHIAVIYRDQYTAPLANLHFVDEEIQYLDSHFKTRTYSYTALDTEKLNAIFNSPSVIHIAAHTVIDHQQEARLLLHQPISIQQLRYHQFHTPLVVLSACNTASGRLLPSEGLASINREFLSKGIPGVVATHWFANDQVTLALTKNFYTHLSDSHSPVQALTHAKREYLSTASEIEANPWYWANMAYTGIDTKIDLYNRTGLFITIGFVIVLVALTALFILYRHRSRSAYPKKV